MSIIKEPSLSIVRRWSDGYKPGLFKIESPMLFIWELKRVVVTIDAGVYTDFSSIPLGLRNIFSINGDHRIAAIIHDYLYERRGAVLASHVVAENGDIVRQASPIIVKYTRKEADDLFYQLMREEGVPNWKAAAMYQAVRLFGSNYAKEWTT